MNYKKNEMLFKDERTHRFLPQPPHLNAIPNAIPNANANANVNANAKKENGRNHFEQCFHLFDGRCNRGNIIQFRYVNSKKYYRFSK